jgi:hypothetical protein
LTVKAFTNPKYVFIPQIVVPRSFAFCRIIVY